jgi:hypothetical protein
MRSAPLDAALEDLATLDQAVEMQREALSEQLHAAISRVDDRTARGRLLQLRRTLYHGHAPDQQLVAACAPLVPPDVSSAIRVAADVLRARAAACERIGPLCEAAVSTARAALRVALGNPDFRKGLLLSSATLHRNVPRYQNLLDGRVTSRDEQIERGLLRYFSRAVMKATPFARFCAVGEGYFSSDSGPRGAGLEFDADPAHKQGHVRLNKGLYSALWERLKARPAIRRALIVELNPTLTIEGGRIRVLAAIGGHEMFQRFEAGPAIDAVIASVRRYDGVTLGSLAELLANDPRFDATLEEVRTYLDAFVGHGLLRLRGFVPEQAADWDQALGAALAAIDDPDAQRVASALAEVRVHADCYAAADLSLRVELNERVSAILRSVLTEIGASPWIPHDMPMFEDASTTARLQVPCGGALDEALARLTEWIDITRPLAHPRGEQATMRHYFDSRYGADAVVPLLQFYEDYYREHMKARIDRARRTEGAAADAHVQGDDPGNPFNLARVRHLREARRRLADLMRSRWAVTPHAESIDLEPAAVREAIGAVAAHGPRAECSSASVFCQIIPSAHGSRSGSLLVPSGQYLAGFGKYFSRFLYALPSALQSTVLANNAALAGADILAEIGGDAHFNANLHPPLAPYEIVYPTGDGPSTGAHVTCPGLDVVANPADPFALQIVERRTGRRVLPLDLGFLVAELRPPLYQLLSLFAPDGAFAAPIPDLPPAAVTAHHPGVTATVPDRAAGDASAGIPNDVPGQPVPQPADAGEAASVRRCVVYRPRFTFGGSVVLSRRRWTIPGRDMPQRGQDGDAQFMVRVDRWRRMHGMPREVYIRVIPEPRRREPDRHAGGGAITAADDRRTSVAQSDRRAPAASPGEGALSAPLGVPEPFSGERASPGDAPAAMIAAGALPPAPRVRLRDLGKPQYIDFTSPLLVFLFARLPGNVAEFHLSVEERYPDQGALPRYGDDAYVTELLLQVDLPAGVNHGTDGGVPCGEAVALSLGCYA